MNTDPKKTLALLDDLGALGFTDEDLQVVHHTAGVTIDSHKQYCLQTSRFRPGSSNARVQARRAFVLQELRASSADANGMAMATLLDQAIAKVPYTEDELSKRL